MQVSILTENLYRQRLHYRLQGYHSVQKASISNAVIVGNYMCMCLYTHTNLAQNISETRQVYDFKL